MSERRPFDSRIYKSQLERNKSDYEYLIHRIRSLEKEIDKLEELCEETRNVVRDLVKQINQGVLDERA